MSNTFRIIGRPPKLTREQQIRVDKWAAERITRKALAAELGVSPWTVTQYARRVHKMPVRA
jgi:DNA-binding CsgD family transcriptional regulator